MKCDCHLYECRVCDICQGITIEAWGIIKINGQLDKFAYPSKAEANSFKTRNEKVIKVRIIRLLSDKS